MTGPLIRPRRLRTTPALRRLVAETRLSAADLVLPLFVGEGLTGPQPIEAMPGVVRHSMSSLVDAAGEAVDAGVGALMVFGVPLVHDPLGSGATDPDGILNTAIRALRKALPHAVLMGDLCLDEFTDHGHCGVLSADGQVDNDATLERYADMAVALAEAGCDLVGPSGMMDGQIAAIRAALDTHGHTSVGTLAYSAKYASAFYGPFREAVGSQLSGDRRSYQQDAANGREGVREALLDIAEGADIVMVKPAMGYLDVVAAVAAVSEVPVAAYQVSGEYSMIEAAAARGWLDRDACIRESLLSIRRAGAQMVLTYWASEVAHKLASGQLSS